MCVCVSAAVAGQQGLVPEAAAADTSAPTGPLGRHRVVPGGPRRAREGCAAGAWQVRSKTAVYMVRYSCCCVIAGQKVL
jgi:hypothetical protein